MIEAGTPRNIPKREVAMNMKTLRHPLYTGLAMTGTVGLVLLAIPILAVLAFVLRAAALVAIAGGLVVGTVLWLSSARFRARFRTWVEPEVTYKGLRLATDVAVHPGHAWSRMDGADLMVGADDLLPTALGPVESVELPPAGRKVPRGEMLFRLRHGNRAVEVPAPVDGTVVACNETLAREPGLVNADPFRRGWAVKLRGASDAGRARRGEDARTWFRAEVDRLLATVSHDASAGPVMADGGVVAVDLFRRIDDDTWRTVTRTLGGARS